MFSFRMDVIRLQQRLIQLTNSLFQEGFLDEQFTQLQQLQDDSNPDFVTEVVVLFFEDSEKLLHNLTNALNKEVIDYKKMDAYVHQFKGSSSRCIQCLQQLKDEYYLFKDKLQDLFHLEQQILSAGGTLPMME